VPTIELRLTQTVARLAAVRVRNPHWNEVGLAAFAAWLLGATAVAVYRPGELLEFAALGFAGAFYWRLMSRATARQRLLALPFLAAPLLNTWPASRYTYVVDAALPHGSFVLSNIPSVLLLAAAAATLRARKLLRPHPLLLGAMVCLLIGGIAATIAATDFSASLQAWWLTFAVPIGLAYLLAGTVRTVAEVWLYISIAVVSALIPVTVGIAAYVLQFGLPSSGEELVRNKQALSRPLLVQDITLGNVSHLGDLVMLLLPAAVLWATMRIQSRVARTIATVASVGYVIALIIVLERAEIFFSGLALAVLGFVLIIREGRRSLIVPGLALAALVAVSASPAVVDYYRALVPSGSSAPAEVSRPSPAQPRRLKPPKTRQPPPPFAVPALHPRLTDASTETRMEAVRKGLRIFRANAPFGVGPGQYEQYDATFTAAHSLPVQLLAEDGVLGGVGFLLVVAYMAREAIRLRRRSQALAAPVLHLRLALLGGTTLFLAQATATGSLFAVGALNVWATLFWLQLGLVAGTEVLTDSEDISAR
jgi:O-Antigen ligase